MKNKFKPALILFPVILILTGSCKKEKNDPAEATGMYFTSVNNNTVNKTDLVYTPNSVTGLFGSKDGIDSPIGIVLTADDYLIVAQETADNILKMRKDGRGDVSVLYDANDGVNSPTAITIDNATGALYWCNSGTDQVMKGSSDGKVVPVAMFGGLPVIDYAYGIAIDKKHKKLYTSDFSEFIRVGNLDGTGTTDSLWNDKKFPGMLTPSNIYVDTDHNKIYWADETSNQVVEANLDGTGTPKVLFDDSDGVDRVDGVCIDYNAKKIYWSETHSHVIARGNLDGSGTREVMIEEVEPYGIILETR